MFGNREYRVYVIDDSAALSRDLECADDAAAIEQARRMFPERLVEVWQGHRLIERIEGVAV